MPEFAWQLITPHQAADIFVGFPEPWWIAGGWAIDLFAGSTTRPHGDMDIALLRGSESALRAHLGDWDVRIAHNGAFEAWSGDVLEPARHQFWARPQGAELWVLEFLLEDNDDGLWHFRRDANVVLPIPELTRKSDVGIPYLCPEVTLLYKAKSAEEPRNARDFETAAPLLDNHARRWLQRALEQAHPGHLWIKRLS